MRVSDVINLIIAVAAVGNTIAVGVGLYYLNKQARHLSKDLRQSAIQVDRLHMFNINRLLIDEDELRQLLGLEKREVLGYMLFNDFEMIFLDHKAGIVDEEYWKAKRSLIGQTVNLDWMKSFWTKISKQARRTYAEDYIKFIDSLIAEGARPEQSRVPFLSFSYRIR